MKKINILLVVLLFALFASIFSLQKIGLMYSEPFFLIGFRMFFAGLLMLCFMFFFKYDSFYIKKNHYALFINLAIFNIYLTNSFEIYGLKSMASSKACLIYSLSPFMTALVSFFILREKLTVKKFFGMIIGFLGLIPMIYIKSIDELKIENFLIFSFSEVLLLFAVFFSVLGWVILKKILLLGYSFILANGISMFFGGIFILLNSFIFGENWGPVPIFNISNFLFYTIVTCIISNIVCYNLFGYLLKYFSTTFMTFFGLITPFFAAFFGWIFLDEIITWHFFISILIFSIGLKIFFSDEKKY